MKKTKLATVKQTNQIAFRKLARIFRGDVIKHFLLTTICTLLFVFIASNSNLLVRGDTPVEVATGGCCGGAHGSSSHKTSHEDHADNITTLHSVESSGDYLPLLGKHGRLIQFFGKSQLTKNEFALFWSLLVIMYAILKYHDYALEDGIALQSSTHLKNGVLEKFRKLSFEQKNQQKDEVKTVAEIDAGVVAESWCHLYNHAYHSSLSIILSIWFNFDDLVRMNRSSLLISALWILAINLIYVFMLNLITAKEEQSKDHLTKEVAFIDKEISKSILIESMGLTSDYQTLQRKVTASGTPVREAINKLSSLNVSFNTLLMEIYLYVVLAVSARPFTSSLKNYALMMIIAHNFGEVLACMREYPAYKSSLLRLNKFLTLPTKNENLTKQIIPAAQIKQIIFQNVDFRYDNSQEQLLVNYSRTFSMGELNNLTGKNGSGKSTIIYLLLGMLKPLAGKILVELRDGTSLDLNNDLNLKDWKENVVAFCSHDNLIDNGSTGQRQIANIKEILKRKESAKIFIFDEASNALDKSKQDFLENNINNLLKNDKIVIFVKH